MKRRHGMKSWVSLKEASALLNVSYSSAWRLSKRGELERRQLLSEMPVEVSLESIVQYAARHKEIYADEDIDRLRCQFACSL